MTTQSERERAAARWLIEQDDADFSDAQREALARWLMQSAENLDTYLRLVRAWRWTLVLRRNETSVVYGKPRPANPKSTGAMTRASTRKAVLDRRFGDVIRKHRLEQGLSQTELAETAGMHPREIALLEAGGRTLTLASMYVLALALKVAPSRLVTELDKIMRGSRARPKAPREDQ